MEEIILRDGLYHSLKEEDGVTAQNGFKINMNNKNKDISILCFPNPNPNSNSDPKKELDITCVKLINKTFVQLLKGSFRPPRK